jgi:integrase
MPKLTSGVPSYRRHKQSGQAIVTLNGRDFLLGPHDSEASHTKYNRLIAEWLANNRQPVTSVQNDLTIADLAARYWRFVARYYVKNGRATDEQGCIRAALRPLLKLYQNELAANFGPVALRAVRDQMIAANWARQTVNKNVDRICRMFRWATSEELLPIETYQRLVTLPRLRKGRCEAKEALPVRPVDDATVAATLPHLSDVVADMVRFQRFTGCRPAEVCGVRPCDIDRSGEIWAYVPQEHKTEHHDRQRVILIGPRAQQILLRYLARDAEAYCFSPSDSEAKRLAARHAARRVPLNYGNKPKPKWQRVLGSRYTTDSYRHAISRACDKAFPPTGELEQRDGELVTEWLARLSKDERARLAKWRAAHRWAPNQLRHASGTEIRAKFGVEASRVILGHREISTTEIYSERDLNLAARIAREVG